MPAGSSWTPLPGRARRGRDAFVVPPFVRLARTHGLSAAGDAAVAVALAGSLFFSINPSEARWRVALYLLLTLAPFAVVAPLIGPAIDRARGGSRWFIVASCGLRAIAATLMVRHLDSLLLFPEAFAMLVLGKGYAVAKSAYLPSTVGSDADLVAANSKLAIISPLAGALVAAPAGLLSLLGGSPWAMGLAALVFGWATAMALRLPARGVRPVGAAASAEAPPAAPAGEATGVAPPGAPPAGPATASGPTASPPTPPAPGPARSGSRRRPHLPAGVLLAASAMGLLRGSVGFLTFLIAFDLRTSGASTAGYGLVLGAVGAGSIGGALLAPQLRRVVSEERLMAGALATTTAAAVLAALLGGLGGALLVIGAVGVAAATAKLAFDSVVQRDSGESTGRAFASFESRFQVLWVLGALIGLASIPMRVGFVLLAVLAGATAVAFVKGRNIAEMAVDLITVPQPPAPAPPVPSAGTARTSSPAPPAHDAPTLSDVVEVLATQPPEGQGPAPGDGRAPA